MKQWIKDLYIHILKVTPDKNVDYINMFTSYPYVMFVVGAQKADFHTVQKFINRNPQAEYK
jgi:hypothetical protein